MLRLLERSITLQLLVFYCLFLLPLLLGGVELYLFQRNALQQNATRADLSLAQAVALDVESIIGPAINIDAALSYSQEAKKLDRQQLTTIFSLAALAQPSSNLYAVCDVSGNLLLASPESQARNLSESQFCRHFLPSVQTNRSLISISRISLNSGGSMVVLARRISDDRGKVVGTMLVSLQLEQLAARLLSMEKQWNTSGELRTWVVDHEGHPIVQPGQGSFAADSRVSLPGVKEALQGRQGSLIAQESNRDWLYSYMPVSLDGGYWGVVIQRPTDSTFATVVSFRNSLGIALFMVLIGASFFWFAMHGGVVAPLKKLAQAVIMIKPDQETKVMDGRLLARERERIDEIGQVIAAFSAMEDEVHDLFRKSDATSQARLYTLDAIMHSMNEGLLLEAPDGHIIYANRRFTQFVGLSPNDLLSSIFDEQKAQDALLSLIEDPDVYQQAVHAAETGSGPDVIEFYVRGYHNPVGQHIPMRRAVRLRVFQVRDQAGELIGRGKVFQDVTRTNEAELIKKNLLAIVSHELRTPLTSIKGYATSLLETDVEMESAMQEDFLRGIVIETDRMAELVTSLLDMSQIEAGTLKLSPSLYPLDVLIKQALPEQEREKVRIRLPAKPSLINVDGKRIEMVLRNLLQNARRYAGADALIEIVVRYEQEDGEVKGGLYLSVIDNGAGIPADLTERIFERFYQVDSGHRRSSSGVGLGLAICRGFIEAHGGRIWAENRADGATGAAFHIWLPPRVLYPPDAQSDMVALLNIL